MYLHVTASENKTWLHFVHQSYRFIIINIIYSSIYINNQKIKTCNVYILAVWTKWQTQGQATYVPP